MTQVIMEPPERFGPIHIPEAPDLEKQLAHRLIEMFCQTRLPSELRYDPQQLLLLVSEVVEQLDQVHDLSADAQAWLYHQGMAYLLNFRDYLQRLPNALHNAVELYPNSEQLPCLAIVVGRQSSRAK